MCTVNVLTICEGMAGQDDFSKDCDVLHLVVRIEKETNISISRRPKWSIRYNKYYNYSG